MELQGQVAIVTGASAGIGRAYALALAAAGATVIAAARTAGEVDAPARNTLAEVVEASARLSGRVEARVCDVSLETDIVHLVAGAVDSFGRVDVLVNNAAIMAHHEPLAVDVETWDRMLDVNLRAAYLAVREVAPGMIARRSGSIVNITAGSATPSPKGQRTRGSLAYVVSKAALNRMTLFLAEELREHGVAVNALSPGVVDTDTALAHRRPGHSSGKQPTPEVLGPPIVFLAQQTAETMTGEIWHTDDFGVSWP